MAFYLFGWFLILSSAFLSCFQLKYLRISFYVCLFYVTALASLRFEVGTDSSTYYQIFDLVKKGNYFIVDIGYILLSKVIFLITDNYSYALSLQALIFSGLLLIVFLLSDESLKKYLLYFFLPVFFYSYSMNVIRLGLAASLVMLSFVCFLRQRYLLSILFFFISVTFHNSMFFLSPLLLFVFFFDGDRKYIAPFLVLLGAALFLFIEQLKLKYSLYFPQGISISGDGQLAKGLGRWGIVGFGGVGRWGIACVLSFIVCHSFSQGFRDRMTLLIFSILLFLFPLMQFNYIGIRLLDLYIFSISFFGVYFFSLRKKEQVNKMLKFYLLVSFIAIFFNIKDLINSTKVSSTPFVPYRTYFSK